MTKKINKELIWLSVKIMVNFYLRCLWLFNFYNIEKEIDYQPIFKMINTQIWK